MSPRKIAAAAFLALTALFSQQGAAQGPEKAATTEQLPSLTLRKDLPVSPQMIKFAQDAGWTLLWEAQEYTTPVSVQISGSPEAVVTYFLDGVRNAGVTLTGVIRPNIKTIQISE